MSDGDKAAKKRKSTHALPAGDPRLAAYDATLDAVDHRQVEGYRGRSRELSRSTQRQYERWLRNYKEWCAARGYQPELLYLDDAKAEEWVKSLVTDTANRPRYAPASVGQALTALGHWTEKTAVHPMPSLRSAYGVLHRYIDELAAVQVVDSRADRRVKRPVQDG